MIVLAWQLFGSTPPGWARVQHVCDFVHRHLAFDYLQARNTRTAYEAYRERVGVCRDGGTRSTLATTCREWVVC